MILWIIVFAIVVAFAVFAGENTMRMRNDIKVIRETVLDTRKKVAVMMQQHVEGMEPAADPHSVEGMHSAAAVESFNNSQYV